MRKKIILSLFCLSFLFYFQIERLHSIENSSTVTYPVGELGEKWVFPSDHLPVGATIGNIHLAAWNTLNTRYIYHILTNQQGLRESLIVSTNIPTEENKTLTVRENLIVDQILEMIDHPKHPRSLIAIQETGLDLFEELKKRLPKHMITVTAYPGGLGCGDIFIYDSTIFEWVSLRSGLYQARPCNAYMTLTLLEKQTSILYHFVQSHVPAALGISGPARRELAGEIIGNFDASAITVVMGDMNRSPDFFIQDLKVAAEEEGLDCQPFANLWIPYPTHIDTHRRASWIDNLFLYNPFDEIPVHIEREANHFFSNFHPIMELLASLRSYPLQVTFELWCKLKMHNFAVLFGAPYSGKTEQMLLALQDTHVETFDLKNRFLDHYYTTHNIVDPEERSKIRMLYQSEDSFKKLEQEWLSKHQKSLTNELLASPATIVVFDEFDLTHGSELNPEKLATVLTIVQMAKRVKEENKQVILLVHNVGIKSSKLWQQLAEDFSLHKEDIITTKYLSENEEKYLLKHTLLTPAEAEKFMYWTQGNPAAYLTVLTYLIDKQKNEEEKELSWETLRNNAIHNVKKIWKKVKTAENSIAFSALSRIAQEGGGIIELNSLPDSEQLIHTGLVGMKQDKLVMPPLVIEVVNSFP
ncbi:MAG: hypothetical protein K940chlam7_01376 [Chlamydiae bacterium]|nr:hypothetical protein [Chlamydiota bacterium]